MATLNFSWKNTIDELQNEWRDCFYNDQAMRSWALQKTIEMSKLSNAEFHHLYVTDEKGPAMLLPCCIVNVSLVTVASPGLQKFIEGIRKVFPKFLYTRMFFIGSAFSTCGDIMGIRDREDASRWTNEKVRAIFDEIIKKAKSVKTSFIIAKELDDPLVAFLKQRLDKNKFFFPECLPTAVLSVAARERGGYLQSIRTRYRNKLKKRRAVAVENGLYWTVATSAEGYEDRIFDLHSQIMDHADVSFERLNREFFTYGRQYMEKDPEKKAFYTFGFQKLPDGGEKLICCEFVLCQGTDMYPVYTGFDYTIKEKTDLYFNAYYALIDEAEKRGYTNIHLGQTAYEVKAELGCTMVNLSLGIHHTNPLIHKILEKFQKIFFDTVKVPSRDVFATPPEPPKNARKPKPATPTESTKANNMAFSFEQLPQIGAGHAALKDYVAYRDNLHGNPERLMPIEGLWATGIALQLGLEMRTAFICPELLKSVDYEKMATEVVTKAGRTFVLSQKVFEKISERDGPSGIACIVKPTNLFENDFSALKSVKRIVLMDAVEVPGNIGTLLRALDGLGHSALILTNKRVRLTHPKVIKGSLGAIFTVPVVNANLPEALKFLREAKIPLFAADSSEKIKTVDFAQVEVPEKFALVLGSEKYGIPQEIYAEKPTGIQIPMHGVCDSLNVSIAGAILLYGLVYRSAKLSQ